MVLEPGKKCVEQQKKRSEGGEAEKKGRIGGKREKKKEKEKR